MSSLREIDGLLILAVALMAVTIFSAVRAVYTRKHVQPSDHDHGLVIKPATKPTSKRKAA